MEGTVTILGETAGKWHTEARGKKLAQPTTFLSLMLAPEKEGHKNCKFEVLQGME